MYHGHMELVELLNKIHRSVEAKENRDITRETMAGRIGVSKRTYLEYLRGTNMPLAMKALLHLLNQLDDDDIVKIVRSFKESNTANE